MKRTNILLFFILFVLYGLIKIPVYANDHELLILKNNVQLKSDLNSLKTIKELQMFEKVKIVKNNLIKEYIQVITDDGKIGWVLVKYTTFITDEWKEHRFDSLVSIMLPKDQKFTILKENYLTPGKGYKASIERKLYNKKYFIININSEENIENYLKMEKADDNQLLIFKKFLFNNIIIYYYDYISSIEETDINGNGSPIYVIIFEGKKNDSYSIGIILHRARDTEDYYLTARKILFSVKRK